jgi:hypothetical protein
LGRQKDRHIFTPMAEFIIHKQDEDDFYDALMVRRDFDLVNKIVASLTKAIKQKKKEVDIFEIIFPDTSSIVFAMRDDGYKECLENCLNDFAEQEMYEDCEKLKKIISKLK